MRFYKEVINRTLIYNNVVSVSVSLNGLQSDNSYNVNLTFAQNSYYSDELAINAKVYNDVTEEYDDITLLPTTLIISKTVNGSSSTVTINVKDSAAYYYGSPYYNLIRNFFSDVYAFREDTFISDFFSLVPEFDSEPISLINPDVVVRPIISQTEMGSYVSRSVLSYSVTDSNFDLYLEPVDNFNQFQLLNSLNQVSGTHLTEEDYRDIVAIEAYNRNYLLAHLQPNVTGNLEISGNINATTSGSGGGSSTVDLSGVVTQLQNINEKLNYEDSTGNNADIAEMLFWIAQALQGGLVYADDQQNLQSYLHYIGKKLEYTQTIDEEPVTKNITETLSDVLKSLDDIVDRPIITTNEDLSPWSSV